MNKKSRLRQKYNHKPEPFSWKGEFRNFPHRVEHILIIQTAFLGDLILTTPLIREIKSLYPNAQIDLLAIPQTAGILKGNPHLRQVFTFNKRDKKRKSSEFKKLAQTLKEKRYDLAMVPHSSFTTARLLKKIQIPFSIGYDRTPLAPWFFNVIIKKRKGLLEIEKLLDLCRPLYLQQGKKSALSEKFFSARSLQTELYPSPEDDKRAQEFLAGLDKNSLIAVAPGSVWETKKWPLAYFKELVSLLLKNDFGVVLIGGPDDQELGDEIMSQVEKKGRLVNTIGKTSLMESAALIANCSLIVSNDSAPLHIGNATQVPVVAIFGATSPLFGFAPFRNEDRIFENNTLYCQPCRIHGSKSCPESHFRCMLETKPEQVFAAIKNFSRQHQQKL